MFFQSNSNYEIINRFLLNHNLSENSFKKRIENEKSSEEIRKTNLLFKDVLSILQNIYSSPTPWDLYCEVSIQKYGTLFIQNIESFKYLSTDLKNQVAEQTSQVESLYLMCVNFFIEREFHSEVDLNNDGLSNDTKISQFSKNLENYITDELYSKKFTACLL
ncbi:hypothetical protein CWC11_13725 [Pseudoalteromonas sp. S3178]|uniref:hypothetical protein n=1 Tax=Pseudoalteromonas sp. S3178 TaxID=579532 RepID=UPI00110B63EB|nr:hypothetical protein [Pseudoalteromonas sp. S3178]TMP03523.1 hypothetical protein CWC11_13725 [Pseudoalteromonas sp. S3178]